MAISLNDFKENGVLRKHVSKIGLLNLIGVTGVDQDDLLARLIASISKVNVMSDSLQNDSQYDESKNNTEVLDEDSIVVEEFHQTQAMEYLVANTYYLFNAKTSINFRNVATKLEEFITSVGGKLYTDAQGTAELDLTKAILNWKKNKWNPIKLWKKVTEGEATTYESVDQDIKAILDANVPEAFGVTDNWEKVPVYVDAAR